MTFISYAQNFEDVMLWRALKHLPEGFYVDVGAWSPELDSVTRAFYERGWRGISIEPNPEFHRQLQESRPRDVNLCLALGDSPGTGTLNIVGNTGLSTVDDEIAENHSKAGYAIERKPVELATLSQVWEKHVSESQDVHFLKVDVEGFEERVISGTDLTRHRPWIILVEATYPMSRDETYGSWEPLLIQNDYSLAYVDGLNRFYVAREHDELLSVLRYPPNYFDGFKQYALVNLEEQLARSRTSAQQAESKVQELLDQRNEERAGKESMELELLAEREAKEETESALAATKEEAGRLISELAAVYASWSWRITWPLRAPLGFLIWLYHISKQVARSLVIKFVNFITERPRLTARLSALLDRLPGLRSRLMTLLSAAGWDPNNENALHTQDNQASESAHDLSGLSEAARRVYWDLKITADRRSR